MKEKDRTTNECTGRLSAAGDPCRVCRAWHGACEVEVLTPGISGAEGKEKGKGVIGRTSGTLVQREIKKS